MNIFERMFAKKEQKRSEPFGYILPVGSAWGITYDGELEPGALSQEYIYDVDYYEMARRAYTLVEINEFAKILVRRLTEFTIGQGLRLHPQPMRRLLKKLFKIDLPEDFSKSIQDFWHLIEDDKNISKTKNKNLHALAELAFYNALIAGDCLIIKRVIKGNLEYEVVNGLSVISSKSYAEGTKNRIIDGVELDNNDVPVAYYVLNKDDSEVRIPARDSKGRLIAWLLPVGSKSANSPRCHSDFGAIMQKIHKVGSYTNSEVMAAEANSKFAVVIEQEKESSGLNPIGKIPNLARGLKEQIVSNQAEPATSPAEMSKFKSSLKNIASALSIFMPKGQKLSSFDTKRPNVNFTQFLDGTMKYLTASWGIPFEVALMLFSNNFSASRASLKMFEVILEHRRKTTINDYFYQPIYEQHFELWNLKGYIQAPKYLELKNDEGFLDNAYTKAKFVGLKIPHIDEVKEVNAVCAKLKGGLSTYEQALETLGITTDFDSLIERRKIEEEKIRASGLNFETIFAPDNGGNHDDEDTEKDTTSYKEKTK